MKKIIIFLSFVLAGNFGLMAQTLSTDTFNAANGNAPAVGDTFSVPINITSIGEINVLAVFLEYDTNVLTYVDTSDAFTTTSLYERDNGIVHLESGNFPNSTVFPDTLLINIRFMFKGGNSDLKFHTSDYGDYASYRLLTNYSQDFFADADVTNGAVEGGYVNNTISGGDWTTASNWTSGVVPNSWHNVFVGAGSETTISGSAVANNVTIEEGGQLTLTGDLHVYGDFVITSTASGNGSFINNGGNLTVDGTIAAECYTTAGQWHGISAPLSGNTFNALYLNGNPDVWAKSYDEATDTYTYITNLSAPMEDMTGYLTWVETGYDTTFTFTGTMRNGTVGTANNMAHAGNGYNLVGNPFTSAIDWNASTGWTKTNLKDAIYLYNNGNWATYSNGTGTNGGSQYISMNQGFFVEVDAAGNGTLTMTNDVQVHNAVGFMKGQQIEQQIIRLQISDGNLNDETVVRFKEGATIGFDADMDAHKLFSFNENYPQIYSTDNDFMSINSLPFDAMESVPMDVKGEDGKKLTISVTEADDFDKLYLKDELTGNMVNLKEEDYTFNYDKTVSDRFTLFFNVTDVQNNDEEAIANVFAYGKNIHVVLNGSDHATVSVYNLLGQNITTLKANSNVTTIPMDRTGYYLVKVNDGVHVTTKKVFIK